MANKNNIILFFILLLFAIITFIIRILPIFYFQDDCIIHLVKADAQYNFHQIEVMVHNFMHYNWFDPMTAYPYGKEIEWGPLFPMIASAFAILMGASQQSDIINTVSFLPPLITAAMVPIVYCIAKSIDGDRLTGIIAAGIVPFISLYFLNYSLYGYVDHHIAEILFSSLFCLFYILAINTSLPETIFEYNDKKFLRVVLYSIIAGILYCACYFTSPTTVLFLLIISIFIFFSCIKKHFSGETPLKEGTINTIVLIIPIILISLLGIKYEGYAVSSYTIIHAIIPLCIILATWFLILISMLLKRIGLETKKYLYPIIIIISGMIFIPISSFLFPDVLNTIISGINQIFGFGYTYINEMEPWNLDYALQSFNFAFILSFGGLIFVLYKLIIKKEDSYLFLIIWMLITIYATIMHLRFEYYLAIPLAILSSICISSSYRYFHMDFAGFMQKKLKKDIFIKNQMKKKTRSYNTGKALLFIFAMTIAALFFVSSTINDIEFAKNNIVFEKSKWIEAMEWMNENTPDPGIDYYGEYSKDTFTYPECAYGVMSYWDFGHIITLIGKRIPNSNPFQDNVAGRTGCVDFFLSKTEDEGSAILDNAGSRFVVTNSELTTTAGGFIGIVNWASNSVTVTDYIEYVIDDFDSSKAEFRFYSPYYNTMIVRLQNLDGTYIKPTSYSKYSTELKEPNCIIPALKHYRLVYETSDPYDNVKIFEYVRGYEISGEGTAELNLVTNTGREFIYRQKSENGKFVLPYSTVDNPYDVKAKGTYHIIETDEYFNVYEKDIGSIN